MSLPIQNKIFKILIIGPSWVGDMVMAHSLFQVIKDQHPNSQIDLLAPPSCEALAKAMPEISEFIALPFKHGEFGFFKRKNLGKKLQANQYNQSIVLPNSWKSALVPFFAKIPIRTGYKGEMRYGLLTDCRVLNKKNLPLMAQRFCALGLPRASSYPNNPQLELFPKPQLTLPEAWLTETDKKFNLFSQLPLIALCPGAEFGPAKKWPPEYYAQVAKNCREAGYQVWILGTAGDQAEGDLIAASVPGVLNLAGKTSLKDAMVILKQASQVITNDSGLMHIRAAFDLPLVAIFGSTSAQFTPPLSNQAQIMEITLGCRPCFQRTCPKKSDDHMRCLKDLKPDQILNGLDLI